VNTHRTGITRRTGLRHRTGRSRAGFSLLEVVVALALVGLVMVNVYTILWGSSQVISARNSDYEADVQARRALDRIAIALIGAHDSSLYFTSEAPGSQSELNYQENLGLQDTDGNGVTELALGPPRRIAWTDETGGEISWFENPGATGERHVVWVKHVPDFGLDESVNGLDDNGNGLIDEAGLAFVKEGRMVRILLTLRRPQLGGGVIERQVQAVVTTRN
jgi:prepilin-type N-terminal cleavage/methylation domain-containing protein